MRGAGEILTGQRERVCVKGERQREKRGAGEILVRERVCVCVKGGEGAGEILTGERERVKEEVLTNQPTFHLLCNRSATLCVLSLLIIQTNVISIKIASCVSSKSHHTIIQIRSY